jgi:hypothetical protein
VIRDQPGVVAVLPPEAAASHDRLGVAEVLPPAAVPPDVASVLLRDRVLLPILSPADEIPAPGFPNRPFAK